MNIIHKIGIAIILIIAGVWGSAYLFNHGEDNYLQRTDSADFATAIL